MSESELIDFSPSSTLIVLSSSGGAAKHQGASLGQYCHDPDKVCYVQSSTEEGKENYKPRYLYPVDDVWCVSETLGEKKEGLFLKNPTKSQTLPTTGWMYSNGKSWTADPSLVISPGPLTLCKSLTATSDSLGEFSRTELWWNGKPVFRNRKGRLLRVRLIRDGVWGLS